MLSEISDCLSRVPDPCNLRQVEGMSESSDGMPNHSEASHFSEPVGLVKELVEKLPGQERLRRALAEATQLGDFPPPAPRLA